MVVRWECLRVLPARVPRLLSPRNQRTRTHLNRRTKLQPIVIIRLVPVAVQLAVRVVQVVTQAVVRVGAVALAEESASVSLSQLPAWVSRHSSRQLRAN